MQELARAHTPEAIAALVTALNSPRERVAAAVALLDRAWGKPIRAIEGAMDLCSYVLRTPPPVDSVDQWLRLHAPRDSRTDPAIDGKPPDRTCVRPAVTMSLAANNDADDAARPLF